MGRRRALEAGTLTLSLVMVTYRSAAHLPRAVRSFRAAARAAGQEVEILVVDHSEDPDELRRLEEAGADRLIPAPNRGYAAGLNRGMAEARGELLLLANPDLHFDEAAVGALVAALEAGFDLVGPQFHLGPFLFPPAEEQTPRAALARWWACRSPGAWRRYLAGRVRAWEAVWQAPAPVEVATLSGALVALRREVAETLGPWDEDYFLYFEETDWLLRAARRGLRLGIASDARVEHAWGHAAAPGEQAERFERSRRRFFERHHGLVGRFVLPLVPAEAPVRWVDADLDAARAALGDPGRPLQCLLTPAPQGFPAAGALLEADGLAEAVERFRQGSGRGDGLVLSVWDSEAGIPLGTFRLPPSG